MGDEYSLLDECKENFGKNVTRATQAFQDACQEYENVVGSLQDQLRKEREAHQKTRTRLETERRERQELEKDFEEFKARFRTSQQRSSSRMSMLPPTTPVLLPVSRLSSELRAPSITVNRGSMTPSPKRNPIVSPAPTKSLPARKRLTQRPVTSAHCRPAVNFQTPSPSRQPSPGANNGTRSSPEGDGTPGRPRQTATKTVAVARKRPAMAKKRPATSDSRRIRVLSEEQKERRKTPAPCPKCGNVLRKDAIWRHLRLSCKGPNSNGSPPKTNHKEQRAQGSDAKRRRVPKKSQCPRCNKMMNADFVTRHMQFHCRVRSDVENGGAENGMELDGSSPSTSN